MPSEYTTKINKIAEVFDGPHATPKKIDSGPYFLSISSLEGGQLDLSKSAHLSDDEFKKWTRRVTPTEGDLLFSYETRLGEAALMPKNITACLGRRMGLLRPIREKVIPDYLLYAYLSPEFQCTITSRTIPGCTVNRIALKDLPNFPIRIPPLSEQRAVVAILKSIDDKINLNRQINQSLESMAQAIFKSWFVDFDPVKAKLAAIEAGKDAEGLTRAAMRAISGKTDDELDQMQAGQPENYARLKTTAELFPAAMQDSELGEVPEGWEVVNLKELSKIISKGTTPSKNQVANAEDSLSISFIKVKDIADDGQINRAGLELIHESIHKGALKRSMLEENDLLFSIAGTIGRVSIVENDLHNSNINQALAFIRLNGQEHLSLVIEHLKSKRIQESAMASVVQGVQANVSLTSVGSFQIIVPKEPILAAWNEVVLPLHTEKLGRQRQNRLLSQLRDTLLPKLLSGELSVDALKITNEQGE